MHFPLVARLQNVGTRENSLVFLKDNSYIGEGINIPLSWWKEDKGVFTDPHIDDLHWMLLIF